MKKGLEPKGQVRAAKTFFLLGNRTDWKICASGRAWILRLSSWKSNSVVKTAGGMKGRDFGQKTMERHRHGYCQSQNLCGPPPYLQLLLSLLLAVSPPVFAWLLLPPCAVGVMSGAHRALPVIYTVTRWRWRIAALLPDVSRKTNGDGGSYRIGPGRGGGAERQGGGWRLYVRLGCCSWCKKKKR